jgi:hypothetical protein
MDREEWMYKIPRVSNDDDDRRQSPLSRCRLPRVAQLTTMMTVAAMATTMMAAPAALLHVARVPTRATDKEIQGVPLATKHRLQARAKGNVHQRRRSLQKKRGTITTEEWAAFNIVEEHKYTTTFERYIC